MGWVLSSFGNGLSVPVRCGKEGAEATGKAMVY